LIKESISNSLQSSLSIEHLAKGVYYLTCELVSGEILTKKVVKE